LSGAFARRAGLKAIGHSSASTLYGTEKTDAGIAGQMEIGGNVLHDLHVYFGGREIDTDGPDGLMGFDLLAAIFATVNFEKSTMQIEDPDATDVAAVPGVHVGADLSAGIPATLMNVQGKSAVVNAILDTGSPREILISSELLSKHGLHMTSVGIMGGCGTLDDMSIGPIIYDKPNGCTDDGFAVHDALLGYDFLKGLSVLHFDYKHAVMILTPRKS